MQELTITELIETNGGISLGVLGGIAVGLVFIASVIYGFINPNKCS